MNERRTYNLTPMVAYGPLSAAGRLIESYDIAEMVVRGIDDITEELRAQLRRCEIRSKWPEAPHAR